MKVDDALSNALKSNFYKIFSIYSRTASLGYGKAPEDKVSTLVLAVISAGLGIPVVLILFGGLFVCIKRRTDLKVIAVTSNNYMSVN